LRIDSHHGCSDRYPLAHLGAILQRNRFEGSILVSETLEIAPPPFVKGIVIRTSSLEGTALDAFGRHPLFCGVCCDLTEGYGEMARRGIPLDFAGDLRAAARLADRYPELRIAIDHLGGPPFDGWERALEEAARSPRVYCKLSALARLAPSARSSVQHALGVFGEHRLMFGSDWPRALPEHTWKASLAAFTQSIGAQPMAVREELLGGTAARFYRIAL
jgi:L-fuconolactonase